MSLAIESFGGKDAESQAEKNIGAYDSFECGQVSSKLHRFSWFKNEKVRIFKRILPLRNSNIAYRSPWILPEAYEKTTPVELQLMYCRFILDHASQFEEIYYSEECQNFMNSYQAYKEFVSTHEEEQSKKEPLQLRGQERVQGPFFGSTNNHILRNS